MATTDIAYSRANPSPRYRDLLSQYRLMHTNGEPNLQLPAAETYSGQSLPRHSKMIRSLVDAFKAGTLLDYGSGKGRQYSSIRVNDPELGSFPSIPAYWGVDSVTCYDPAYEPFSQLPQGRFDGVISTDVLEHCPEGDLDWIVAEMLSFAEKFVYANVACYPARKRLANGENAHCTIRPANWWHELFQRAASHRPGVRYFICLDELVSTANGQQEMRQTLIRG